MNERAREAAARLRTETIEAYGGQCAECGSRRDLQLDHTDGGGKAHRLAVVGSNTASDRFRAWLRSNGWPNVVQLLCEPCHRQKTLRELGYDEETCPAEHPRTPENTYWRPRGNGKFRRVCKPCERLRNNQTKYRRRGYSTARPRREEL